MNEIDIVRDIRILDYDYDLPDERIPRHPLAIRDSCKLLESGAAGEITHRVFRDLPGLLPDNSILFCNDTRVINARISFQKETGSKIEVFLLEPLVPEDYILMFQTKGKCRWSCMIGNLKRWKSGTLSKRLRIGDADVLLSATRLEPREGNCHVVEFEWNDDKVNFATIIDAAGYIPIPPYLKRMSEDSDSEDYQTVYARFKGSVAAPTAGLHFTPELMCRIRERGIKVVPVTLHVGAGTFQPVKSDTIGDHPMHTEVFSISKSAVSDIIEAKRKGMKITAVGTTTVRTLESLPYLGRKIKDGDLNVTQWEAYENPVVVDGDSPEENVGRAIRCLEALCEYMEERKLESLTASTSIMIAPGFRWGIVDVMVTNFHQPQSTLLLLVSSFLEQNTTSGRQHWQYIYKEALANDYRFLSYGDACLLFPLKR